MKAAVVRNFDHPPCYEDYPDPVTRQPGEVVVEVVAAGLHSRVRLPGRRVPLHQYRRTATRPRC